MKPNKKEMYEASMEELSQRQEIIEATKKAGELNNVKDELIDIKDAIILLRKEGVHLFLFYDSTYKTVDQYLKKIDGRIDLYTGLLEIQLNKLPDVEDKL